MKKISIGIVLIVLLAPGALYHFRSRSKNNLEYLFNMRHTPAYKSFSANPFLKGGQTLQPPVAGTIPQNIAVYDQSYEEAKALANPFSAEPSHGARGQKKFESFCLPCHGPRGAGEAPVSPPFPLPPSLVAPNARRLSDGEIFYLVTHGRNLMPAYASQIEPEDRWKIVLYLRQLQRETQP